MSVDENLSNELVWEALQYEQIGSAASNGSLKNDSFSEDAWLEPVKTAAVVPVSPDSVDGDIDGNGQADVVLAITRASHADYGASGAWLIQSNQTAVWGDLSKLGNSAIVLGIGRTSSGKETSDVYVYDTAAKWLGAWVTDSNGAYSSLEGINQFNANMNVLGLGDFNGDGQSDVLLRSDTGDVGCWFTSGTNGWNYFQSLGNEWDLVAVGDFNNDGRDDVVLTNANGGFAGCWLTNADGTVSWASLDLLNGAVVVGAGDFNNDGTDDVLLKKGNYYGAWIVQNGNASAFMGLGTLEEGAVVEQVADFDGNGTVDLRIRKGDDIGALLVKGEDNLEWHYYGSVGSEWSTSLASI